MSGQKPCARLSYALLRVPHDEWRHEDIGWTRVDVGKDPPGLWKKVYIDDEAAGEVREDLILDPYLSTSTISREVE